MKSKSGSAERGGGCNHPASTRSGKDAVQARSTLYCGTEDAH